MALRPQHKQLIKIPFQMIRATVRRRVRELTHINN